MNDILEQLQTKLKDFAGGWPSYVTLGSFVLYLLGYLSIRFHLTTLGLGTDLAVLDERYVFAGAKFVVFLFSSVPIIVMFGLLLTLLAAVMRRLYKTLAQKSTIIKSLGDSLAGRGSRFVSDPRRMAILGIIVSVILIQIVMRKCFLFSNLLLQDSLPQSGLGLEQLFLDSTDTRRSLFFVGLLAGSSATALLFLYARAARSPTSVSKFLVTLLAFLVVLQFLFLPINYGVFIMDKAIPRVSDVGDQTPLKEGQRAWLVWEGTHGVTYLLQDPGPAPTRKLVTLPQKELKRIEIISYDQIIKLIFDGS